MDRKINIISIPKKGNSTAIALMAKVGSRYEADNIKGISHFIEHLIFKGTKKRNAYEIAKSIEQYGGNLNAFTSQDVTCYWANIANRYSDKALDTILDMVYNPIFPPKEIDKERQVIIQELKMYRDNPTDYTEDLFERIFWTEDSSLHYPIAGTEKSINNIKREDLIEYYETYYNNLTLIVIGKVDKKLEKRNFTDYPLDFMDEPNNEEIYSYLDERKGIQQANLLIGNYIYSSELVENTSYLDLLSGIYNDMSGRLFIAIREKNNLVYGIKFYYDWFPGMICWQVSLGLEKDKINQAKDLIIKELSRPITKKEIKLATQKVIGESDMFLDHPLNVMKTIVDNEAKFTDWKNDIYNYPNLIKKAGKNINDIIKLINFKKNLMVGVIPCR